MKYLLKISLLLLLLSCLFTTSCKQNSSDNYEEPVPYAEEPVPYAVGDDYDIVFQVVNASGMDLTIQPSLTSYNDGYLFNNYAVSIKKNEMKIFHFKYDTLTKVLKDKYGNKYSDLSQVYLIGKINESKWTGGIGLSISRHTVTTVYIEKNLAKSTRNNTGLPLLKEDKTNYDCIYEVTNESLYDVYFANYVVSQNPTDMEWDTNYRTEHKLVKSGETIKLYYNYADLLKKLDQYINQGMYLDYINVELNQHPSGWVNSLTNSNMVKKFTINATSNESTLTQELLMPENAEFSINENNEDYDLVYKVVNNTDSPLQVANVYQVFYEPYDEKSWVKLTTTPEKTLAPNESIEFKYNVEELSKNNKNFSNSYLKYGMAVEAKNDAGYYTYGQNLSVLSNNKCTTTFTGSGNNIRASREFSTIK